MSVTVTLKFETKPESTSDLEALFADMLPDTRSYKGCISVVVMKRAGDPDSWFVLEEWETQKDHESYMKWRAETGALNAATAMFAGDLSISYWEQTGM